MPGRSPTPAARLLEDMPETPLPGALSDPRPRLPDAPPGIVPAAVLAAYVALLGLVPNATAVAGLRLAAAVGPDPGLGGPLLAWLAAVAAVAASPAVARRGAIGLADRLEGAR